MNKTDSITGLQMANLVTVIDHLKLLMWFYVDETDITDIGEE